MLYDIIIIGSGPAGLTAAIYAARSNFKTLVLAGESWGGGLMTTTEVENFPGFPEGIQGPDLMAQIRKQAEKYNVEIVQANFQKANYSKKPFLVTAGDKTYETKAMIIATGATHSPLDVPGEEKLIGRGVSYCATCDAAFFRNKDVAVVGGGDSALTEAIFIANFAKNVFLIHRRDSLKACGQMQEKTKEIKNIHFIFNTRVLEILGDQKVEKIRLKTNPSDKSLPTKSNEEIEKIMPAMLQGVVVAKEKDSVTWDIKVDGVFAAVGYKPVSELFPEIEKDEKGYLIIKENSATNIEGIFVAGDVSNNLHKQAIVAAGLGATAALDAEKWLNQ